MLIPHDAPGRSLTSSLRTPQPSQSDGKCHQHTTPRDHEARGLCSPELRSPGKRDECLTESVRGGRQRRRKWLRGPVSARDVIDAGQTERRETAHRAGAPVIRVGGGRTEQRGVLGCALLSPQQRRWTRRVNAAPAGSRPGPGTRRRCQVTRVWRPGTERATAKPGMLRGTPRGVRTTR